MPGTRQWIHASITRPERLAVHLRVALAHDWDRDFFNLGAPYVLELMRDGEEGWWYWWAIERPTEGRTRPALIGFVGFKGPPTTGGNIELMYNIAASSRGRGFAPEGTRLILDWAFQSPKVRRVIATIDPENTPSQAVVRKCGFSRLEDECDEDELVFALDRVAHARPSAQCLRASAGP